ncbi:hypothetical protein [Paracoccus marinaquae]|nr:hypothetical protein [Paracoccus marinaquae]
MWTAMTSEGRGRALARLPVVLAVLGLAACGTAGGDRVPYSIDGKTYVVEPDPTRAGDLAVTGPAGAALTAAEGAAADRAVDAFCRTQGYEGGTAGTFMSALTGGYWYYEACRS